MSTIGAKLSTVGAIASPFVLNKQAATSQNVEIAREVTTLLNDAPPGTFPLPFQAVRRYAPVNTVESLTELVVSIISPNRETEFLSRKHFNDTCMIDIAIQKKISDAENVDELDPLMLIAETIMLYLAGDNQDGSSRRDLQCGAGLMKATFSIPYSPTHLKEHLVFTAILTLTYLANGSFR